MDNTSALAEYSPPNGPLDRFLRRAVLGRLEGLADGCLRVHEEGRVHVIGDPREPAVDVTLHDDRFWRMMASGGSVGAAEAYMAGLWDCDDLTGLVCLLARNRGLLDRMERGQPAPVRWLRGLWHRRNRNNLAGSRRNIAVHYDLGNDFFAAWLDSDMQYSCALYRTGRESLEQAQRAKLDSICEKLELSPGDHLLEIGTGWGGLAVHAAREYGCRVTTTTISRAQHDHARRLIDAAGLGDRITLLQRDYRELEGRFDKLVSVEMIEAVGADYLDTYLEVLHRHLEPGGLALIQAITIEDFRYHRALKTVDFIKRYIFPGSFIPSVSAITDAMARTGDFSLIDLEDIGPSYALTLRAWRERFEAAWPDIRAMGFDEAFRRRWRYYLAYCEGGFTEGAISDVHLLLARPGHHKGLAIAGRAGVA